MPAQDTSEIKGKMVSIISQKGPCLPIIIAKEAGLSSLFTSAFLSELVNESKIKRSNMKVGSSPLYFTQGQEQMLGNFSEFLKNKEREAFNLLKSRKILKDSEQEPSIRVALRAIKDFAISFKDDENTYWKYFLVLDEEVKVLFGQQAMVRKESGKLQIEAKKKEDEKDSHEKTSEAITPIKTARKKTASGKKSFQGEKFLARIREFLSKSGVEILGIESIGKNELVLRVRENQEEHLLIAFSKKRVTEREVVKASKRASALNLRYSIVSLGKLPKKIHDLIAALKSIKKIDEVK